MPKRTKMILVVVPAILVIGMLIRTYVTPTPVNQVFIAMAQLKGLQLALEMYHDDFSSYPDQRAGLAILRQPIGRGPYITSDLEQDPWGRPFLYTWSDGNALVIETLGMDGQRGGTGPDADRSISPFQTPSGFPSN